MKKALLVICTIILGLTKANAQEDTTFWFAAPEINDVITTYDGLPADRPIILHFAAKSQDATIQISQPALNSILPTQTITVPANSMGSVDLSPWIDAVETKPSNSILTTGLKITSTAPITAYYTNEDVPNPESFMLKGSFALGNDFWIPSQNLGNIRYNTAAYSSFDIVATQDKTTITITPSEDIVGHIAGVAFSIMLKAGETWSAQANGSTANQYLGGSHVTSNNPIAITVKDDLLDCIDVGSGYDLIGDQIIPTNKLGNKYIAVKGDLSGQSDRIFIMATEDNTIVNQDGVQVTTLNKGETSALSFNANDVTYIETSKPSSAFHLSGVSAEIGAKQLIPITEKGCDTVFYQRLMSHTLMVTLVVPKEGINGFLVNGSNNVITGSQFSAVPGNTSYNFAKIDLSNSAYNQGTVLKVVNTISQFQMGVLDGFIGWGADYAYFNQFKALVVDTTGTSGNTGIGNVDVNGKLQIYPNPTKNILIVDGKNISNIRVFNLLGQKQKVSIQYNTNQSTVVTEGLSEGTYFIELSNKYGIIKTLKFTKASE